MSAPSEEIRYADPAKLAALNASGTFGSSLHGAGTIALTNCRAISANTRLFFMKLIFKRRRSNVKANEQNMSKSILSSIVVIKMQSFTNHPTHLRTHIVAGCVSLHIFAWREHFGLLLV